MRSKQRKCCCGFWILIGYLLLFSVLVLQIAATYQSIGIAMDIHSYPPPGKVLYNLLFTYNLGRLIEVTEYKYKLHIHCVGENINNSRTVVIDSGLTFVSTSWNLVLPGLF